MQPMYYIGLDVHKRKISYCVKVYGERADDAASWTGRVIRLARYSPVHVALTRIISVIIRNKDRYTPRNGRLMA